MNASVDAGIASPSIPATCRTGSGVVLDCVPVDDVEPAVVEVVVVASNADTSGVVEGSNCGRIGNG